MKAIRFHRNGGPEVLTLEECEAPEPGFGQVRVRVRATSLNHLDVWVRRGLPGLPPSFPWIAGSDVSGTVEALGPGVDTWKPGDEVLANPGWATRRDEFTDRGEPTLSPSFGILGEHYQGADAEYVCLPAANLFRLPEGLDPVEAAAVPLVFLTAWRMLITRGRLKPGEDVLILAAGGGVGSAALQIAKAAGCRVFATASTRVKLDKAVALGADVPLLCASTATDSNEPNNPDPVPVGANEPFDVTIKRLTHKRGVDVVVDTVGKDTWPRSLRAVRNGGRILTCGATTGFDPTEDLRHIFFRQVEVIGSTMGNNADLASVLKLIGEGRLKPVIDRVLPLVEVAEAHRAIESREVFGKIVMKVD